MTPTTSTTDNTKVICTSATEARMVSVRSVTMASVMPAGMACCSAGSAAWMRFTVSTMLAPGWRWMSSTAAGWMVWPLARYHAASRLFSTPPTTWPTADSRTGAPFRHAKINSR